MAIADNFKAIKAGVDRLNGVTPEPDNAVWEFREIAVPLPWMKPVMARIIGDSAGARVNGVTIGVAQASPTRVVVRETDFGHITRAYSPLFDAKETAAPVSRAALDRLQATVEAQAECAETTWANILNGTAWEILEKDASLEDHG